MIKVNVDGPLTDEIIKKANSTAQFNKLALVFKNTRDLSISQLKKLNHNITISITGGLDPKKNKFNNEYYQTRTYYSPTELISIVSAFEKIERKINPIWSDLEKCMFIYKSICEFSTYEENNYNGRDAARNLLGMITGKSVCAGYAMIFKEAMDRVGIKCYYQNKTNHHGWNIVEIDGKYRSIDLTYDTYSKKNNTCSFKNFCRYNSEIFYSDRNHDISKESEEEKFDLEPIPDDVLRRTLHTIRIPRINAVRVKNFNGIQSGTIYGNYEIVIHNNIPYLKNGNSTNTFIRKDNSSFLLIPTYKTGNNLREYLYIVYSKEMKVLKYAKIYSEMDLLIKDSEMRHRITNDLLSRTRITKKINNFNGYVGYIEKNNHYRYYSESVERSLNIHR